VAESNLSAPQPLKQLDASQALPERLAFNRALKALSNAMMRIAIIALMATVAMIIPRK
jgi:hypothetical protein